MLHTTFFNFGFLIDLEVWDLNWPAFSIKSIPTGGLMKKDSAVALTFLQWFKAFFDKNVNRNREYTPLEARGGQSMVPAYSGMNSVSQWIYHTVVTQTAYRAKVWLIEIYNRCLFCHSFIAFARTLWGADWRVLQCKSIKLEHLNQICLSLFKNYENKKYNITITLRSMCYTIPSQLFFL